MNKIALQVIGGWRGSLGRARLVKLVDVSVEYVAQVRAEVGPRALIIVRWVQGDQPLDKPAPRAHQFVARYQSAMLAMRQAAGPNVAFEGYNEIADSSASAYCAFETERLRLMHALGLRSVVGNFSVGTPDLPTWATYRPMLLAMAAGDLLGLHEYWTDSADIINHWHCGRYELVPELYGFPFQIVITECGRDRVEGRGEPGWRRTCSAETFLADLAKYNAVLERQGSVVGATVFTTPGPGGGWADFDPSPIWPQVVARYSDPQSYPGTPPLPEPTSHYGCSDRQRAPILGVVWHGAEGHNVARYFASDEARLVRQVSAHWAIERDGRIDPVVPEELAAWHCGGSAIPGWSGDPNACTIGIEMACDPPPAAPGWSEAQIASAIRLGRDLRARHGLRRDRHWRHSDIDPSKSDPRGFPWERLLDGIYGEEETVEELIRKAAWETVRVPWNPVAAFPRFARQQSLGAPLGQERDVHIAGIAYRLQTYAGGVVYARVGDWGNCKVARW